MKQFKQLAPMSAILWTAFLLATFSGSVHAAGLPIVASATVDYNQNTLTINGQNFGGKPNITLGSLKFPTLSSSSSQIVGSFPAGTPPSSFAPGTYFLTLQYNNQLPSIFTVDIGASGPQGPQGPIGMTGTAGSQGPAGPAGAQGAQ